MKEKDELGNWLAYTRTTSRDLVILSQSERPPLRYCKVRQATAQEIRDELKRWSGKSAPKQSAKSDRQGLKLVRQLREYFASQESLVLESFTETELRGLLARLEKASSK